MEPIVFQAIFDKHKYIGLAMIFGRTEVKVIGN